MLKKMTIRLSSILSFLAIASVLEGAEAVQTKSNPAAINQTQEKYSIMKRDQVEPTDSLAIPFDESEIEDEEQIDLDDKKDVFDLPHEKK